jgi:Effector-associated domain 11
LIEPNDIISRKNEIKGYVATAKLDLAVKHCIDFYRDFGIEDDDEAILVSRRFYSIMRKEKAGDIAFKDADVEYQQIARSILQLVKDFSNLQLSV